MEPEQQEGVPTQRILVVEDDTVTQRFMSHLLQSENFDVTVCAEGGEAVSAVMSDCPDLIVLDLGLPSDDPFSGTQFDGITVLDWLRRMMPHKAPPVIVLTARDPSVKPKVLAAGAYAFIVKGCPPEDLLEAILGE